MGELTLKDNVLILAWTCGPQMGAGVVTSLLDYWDPESYGLSDLTAELDFMHPVGAERPRKFITVRELQSCSRGVACNKG